MRRMRKRIVLVVLAAVILVCAGCGGDSHSPNFVIPKEFDEVPDFERLDRRKDAVSLYFLKTGPGIELAAEKREIEVENKDSIIEAAIKELIKGPEGKELAPVFPYNTEVLSVQVTGNVANINFNGAIEEISNEGLIAAYVSIGAMVHDLRGIDNIRFFANGKSIGYNGQPIGIMNFRGYMNSIQSLYLAMENIISLPASAQEHEVMLYFANTRGDFILPEYRKITAQPHTELMVHSIIEELKKGSSAGLASVIPADLQLVEMPLVTRSLEAADAGITIEINIDRMPEIMVENTDLETATLLAYAAIVQSICSYVPDVEAVVIKQNGRIVEDIGRNYQFNNGNMSMQDFDSVVGQRISVYFSGISLESLVPVDRVIEYRRALDIKECLAELLRGPLAFEGDDTILPVAPLGVSSEDIKTVAALNDIIYIDVTEGFAIRMAEMSRRSEWLFVHSIINTATLYDPKASVQFLIEGEIREYFGQPQEEPRIAIFRPIMRNAGAILE